MNKKNLFLIVTTLFFSKGFFIKTNAMFANEEKGITATTSTTTSTLPLTSSSTTSLSVSKIEALVDDADDVESISSSKDLKEKHKIEEKKDKKRKREVDENGDVKDDGKALEKRSNVELQVQQIIPFSFSADTLFQMNAFFNAPESQVVDNAILNGHVKTLVNLIKTHQKSSIRVFLPILAKLNNNLGQNFLHLLAIDGKSQEIRYLFDNFNEVMSSLIDSLDQAYKSALFYAVINGYDEVVSCLLDNGATILLSDNQFSLLHCAAQKGFSGIIGLLVKSNINMIMTKDAEGKTPLHIAVESGFEKAVETLIEAVKLIKRTNLFSFINSEDNNGRTCLHYAAKIGNTIIANLLLHNKADVNAVDNNRMTPLHILLQNDPTARKRNTTCSMVRLFLEAGADVTLVDSADNKPHDYVANDHPIKQTLKKREKEIAEAKRRGICSLF